MRRLAAASGVAQNQICHHRAAAPDQLVQSAFQYDIGLALEEPNTMNRDICICNKVFTYLLAGNALAATATEGQIPIIRKIGSAGFSYQSGRTLLYSADQFEYWCRNREPVLNLARWKSWEWGSQEHNWELEKSKLLNIVKHALNNPVRHALVI